MSAQGFFKSPSTGNAVTWDENGKHTDTGIKFEAFDLNSFSNRGNASDWNKVSDMPTETYEHYLAKWSAARKTELGAWLIGGANPMSYDEWAAQKARAEADAKRGIRF